MEAEIELRIKRSRSLSRSIGWLSLGAYLLGAVAAPLAFVINRTFASMSALLGLGALAGGCLFGLVRLLETFAHKQSKTEPAMLKLEESGISAGKRRLAINDVHSGYRDKGGELVLKKDNGERWFIEGLTSEQELRVLAHAECLATQRSLEAKIQAGYQDGPVGCERMLAAALLPLVGLVLPFAPMFMASALRSAIETLQHKSLNEGFRTLAMNLAGIAVYALVVYTLYRFYRQRNILVGSEGLRIEQWFWGNRYIPFHHVRSSWNQPGEYTLLFGHDERHKVEAYRIKGQTTWVRYPNGDESELKGVAQLEQAKPYALVFEMKNAERFRLPVRRREVAARIEEAMANYAHRRSEDLRLADLEQGSLDEASWRDRLRTLATSTDDYRRAQLGPDGLLRVVEDPGAAPRQRIAAAYALSQGDDPPTHRIRVGAQSCADDDLRIALENAAEGQLDMARMQRSSQRFGES